MLKRLEKSFKVYDVPSEKETGKDGEYLGYYPLSFCFRTSEEVGESDMLFSNLRYSASARDVRVPNGGYRRGMTVVSGDGEKFRILVALKIGRMWTLKLESTVYDGDGGVMR